MISNLYNAIIEALEGIKTDSGERLVKHIDLWNRNVEFLEEEQPWPKPAVFIEFGLVEWFQYTGEKRGFMGKCPVILHVVTDWVSGTSSTDAQRHLAVAAMDLSEHISKALHGLKGEDFCRLSLRSSQPNHDHELVVESLENYTVELERKIL